MTQISPGTHHTIFISWVAGSITSSSFTIKGIILSGAGVFSNSNITLSSPVNSNLTALLLFNQNGLQDSIIFNPPFPLVAGTQLTIPITLRDISNPVGTITYTEEAIVSTPTQVSVITSTPFNLIFNSFRPGSLNFNQTNTNVLPIYFITTQINASDKRLSVIYPNTMNLQCNLAYTYAFTNKTYGAPLPNVPYTPDPNHVNSSFIFHKVNNEIITVSCLDTISSSTGKYILTQTGFPLQTQVSGFRNGTFGTHGQFGVFDLISLVGIIIAMIGFNRKNESVGAFFALAILGIEGLIQIITINTAIIGALIVITMLIYLSTRKSQDFG
uniref:ORF63 n=1 Tax=Nitrosopumilaceae spindle-shaped virus TaxID=3065433 RepID=A0AAT9JA01_9VIRU